MTKSTEEAQNPLRQGAPEPEALQLIPGFGLSVLIPNFTISPDCIGVDVENMITPCGVFSPVHPRSVLKDLKLKSLPNHIRNLSIFEVLSLF